jgi:hypothetical protein
MGMFWSMRKIEVLLVACLFGIIAACGTQTGNARAGTERVPEKDTSPLTYAGEWLSTRAESGMHVRRLTIERNEFPCKGTLEFQYGDGQVIAINIVWEDKGEELAGMFGEGSKKDLLATIKLTGRTLSGKATAPIFLGGQKEFNIVGLTKKRE